MSAAISGTVSPNGILAAASPSALNRVTAMRMRPSAGRQRQAILARWLGELRHDFSFTGDSLDTIPGSPYTGKTITAPAHPGRFSFMPGSP